VPYSNLTTDYLVVAGGGGGGKEDGGGGGAGGLRSTVTTTGGGGSLRICFIFNRRYFLYCNCWSRWCGGHLQLMGSSNSVFSTITSTGGGKGAGS
jgi:hypothetical protein